MALIKKLNKWANSHTYYPLDLLRIALGVFLIFKGFFFFKNSGYIMELLKGLDEFSTLMWAVHYIGLFHFVGGILIVFGLLTRWSLIAQLPIFLGAVLINFIGELHPNDLLQASIVLVVSVFFIFYGSGKHSADYDLKMEA